MFTVSDRLLRWELDEVGLSNCTSVSSTQPAILELQGKVRWLSEVQLEINDEA